MKGLNRCHFSRIERMTTSLKEYNSFGVQALADELLELRNVAELEALLPVPPDNILVLGGGSNVLFTGNVPRSVWLNRIDDLKLWQDGEHDVIVKVGGGVVWDTLVEWAVHNGYGGIENLSLIPGTVGAAPIQNIGAYGVELKDVFDHLEAYELATGRKKRFDAVDCNFGYRDSFFKRAGKGKYIITHVYLRLHKDTAKVNTEYGALRDQLQQMGVSSPTISDLRKAVIAIRQSKLPDPASLGNAGSFFKNPELHADALLSLREKSPDVVYYELPDGRVKIPAGWLIEKCGWKGAREGGVGCYEKQALVLVNHGEATGSQIARFAEKIMESVQERFGIVLETEVNIL